MGRVVVLGSLNIDLVVPVGRHPSPGETVIGGRLQRHFGGKGANQAVAAAAAGAHTVMVGRVGDDDAGHAYRDRLAARGVDVGRLVVDPQATTGHALIAVDPHGENTIVVSPGANAAVSDDEVGRLHDLRPGDVLLMSLEVDVAVVAAAARAAQERGARVVVNLAPYTGVDPTVLRLADPVVVNEHEHAELATAVRSGRHADPPSMLVTRGASGSSWGDVVVPAATVTRVVDTTGAGDTYCGALAAGLARGQERRAAMAAATVAAGASVTWIGAQPRSPLRADGGGCLAGGDEDGVPHG